MMAFKEEKGMIYVLLSSGISEDAARSWARTFARIARCAARWAKPSWFRDSELKGDRSGETGDAVFKADKMDSLPAGSWDKILCNSQVGWVMATSADSAPSSGL